MSMDAKYTATSTAKSTVIVEQYRNAAHREANANSYKGLRIHALPGLHDFVAYKALDFFSPGATVLDIAAGSGALSQRLQDFGFKMSANDYVVENFRLTSIPFIHADLNANFSELYPHRFQSIVASEIIEHLENPRHFARECYKLLPAGGRVILTTPNIDNNASKASFLRSGKHLWFTDADYQEQGHIMPLSQWLIRKSFVEAGFEFIWVGSFGKGASRLIGSPRLKILTKIVGLLSSCEASLAGEIFVAVVEKPRTGQSDTRDDASLASAIHESITAANGLR